MDDLREHRQGTEDKLGIETDAASMVNLIETWKHEQKKQRKATKPEKEGAVMDKDMASAEEVANVSLRQMKDFSELVKRETANWRWDARKEDVRCLRMQLVDSIETAQTGA